MKLNSFWGINSASRQRLYNYSLKFPRFLSLGLLKYLCRINISGIDKLQTPKRLIFYITNRCNAACMHCFYKNNINKELDKELSLKEIKKFVLSLRGPIDLLLLTGGEPILQKDIVEICRIFETFNKTHKITLSTNGLLPELIEDKIKNILDTTRLNVNIQVSIDGLGEVHEEIRGIKGIFGQAIDTVGRLKKLQNRYSRLNEVWVITTISNKNIEQIKFLMDFVQNKLKTLHKFQFLRPQSGNINFDKACSLPSLEDLEQVYNTIASSIPGKDSLLIKYHLLVLRCSLDILKGRKGILKCFAGKIDGVIYPDGDVALCETTRPFGNLRDWNLDFYGLWNSDLANRMRDKTKDCFCINPCNLATSLSFDGNLLSKFLYSKEN